LNLENLIGYTFNASDSPSLNEVLQEKKPLTFCDPNRTDIFSDGIERIEEVQWCLVVPLLHRGKAIGLLTLEQLGHCYDQDEEAQIAFTFANHAAIAIKNAKLFEESQKLAVLEERDRLARDMHDGLVQTLSFLNMKLEATQTHLASGQSRKTHGDLVRMREVVTQAYEDLRELIVGLKDSPQPDIRLEEMVQERLKSLHSESKISVQLITDPDWNGDLEPHINKQIANIVQEALLNVHKHSKANNAWVHFCHDGDMIQIIIEDDGKGFKQEQYLILKNSQAHFGLDIMQERAESIGGNLIINSQPGNGTRIELNIPVDGHTSSPTQLND
jgi:nitrate/nitrite-specific signal transduction histidine kinase